MTALAELPLLLEERGMRRSLSNLGSPRSVHSGASFTRSAASIKFSERSAASGIAGMKCQHCAAMGIRICAQCSSKRSIQNSARPSLLIQSEKRKVKVEDENSADAQDMLRCLREEVVDLEEIKALLTVSKTLANVRESTFGWYPLLFAAHRGDAQLLSLLLDCKADVNVECFQGNSTLHLAARRGNVNAATLLQSRGADIDAKNAQGWTPLMWSAIAGCSSIASILMDADADPSARDAGGRTACMWAARHGHTDILRNLLSKGADLSLRDEDGWTIKDHAKYYAKQQKSIAAAVTADRDESSTLYWATDQGSLDLTRLLMQHGAGPGQSDGVCLEAPLKAVAEAMHRSEQLLDAARRNNWEAAEEALRAGACASTRGEADRLSPLHWAAMHDAPASAFSLVAAMADLEACDPLGWTALHHAVHAQSAQMVAVLHYLGADFAAKSEEGDSVQHLAALSDAEEMLQLLGPTTSDWNICNAAGHTPLQVAATRGCLSAVRALLALQADANVKDDRGQSLLSLAAAQGHRAVVRALLEPIDPLPQTWGEAELAKMLEKLPWVDSDVVDNDANVQHGSCGRSNASVCSGSSSASSTMSTRNDKLGTKLAGKLLHRQKNGMSTIKEVESDAGSALATPRGERPTSAGSHASLKSTALTHVSSQSQAVSVARSSHSQASVRSLAKSSHSQMSGQSLARSAHSQASLHSKASRTSGVSRASLGSRSSAGGKSKLSKLGRVNNGPPTIYSMALTEIDRSPVSLMNAACKKSLGPQLPPAFPVATGLSTADSEGAAPLSVAVRARQADMVRLLLELKANPDASDSPGTTALMLAATVGDRHMLASLLDAGAYAGARNIAGFDALALASNCEVREILQAEMDKSAVKKAVSKSCSLPSLVRRK